MELYSRHIPGSSNPVWLRRNTSDGDLFRVLIEEQEYNYFTFLNEPQLIIDAGANIGLSTVHFALKYPNAIIYAIEPEQNNYELLKLNTRGYSNIIPIHAALMAHEGMGKIIDVGQGDLAYQISLNVDQNSEHVECLTILGLYKKYNIEKVDLFKMDIEGAEKDIFEENEDWIYPIRMLIIELHDRIHAGCNKSVFKRIEDIFEYGWIGGENYFFAKKNVAIPCIPDCFKTAQPLQLPIERVWTLQSRIDNSLNPIFERIDRLEGLYNRVDTIEGVAQRVSQLEQSYSRIDALEGLYHRTDQLEQLYGRVDSLEELYHRVDQLEQLYKRMDLVEGLYHRVDQLELLFSRMDCVEQICKKQKYLEDDVTVLYKNPLNRAIRKIFNKRGRQK